MYTYFIIYHLRALGWCCATYSTSLCVYDIYILPAIQRARHYYNTHTTHPHPHKHIFQRRRKLYPSAGHCCLLFIFDRKDNSWHTTTSILKSSAFYPFAQQSKPQKWYEILIPPIKIYIFLTIAQHGNIAKDRITATDIISAEW